jgi:hypothetical protein
MIKLVAWIGAVAIAIAPFIIDTDCGKYIALLGSSLLGFQAVQLKAYNLVFLNGLAIIGYIYVLHF